MCVCVRGERERWRERERDKERGRGRGRGREEGEREGGVCVNLPVVPDVLYASVYVAVFVFLGVWLCQGTHQSLAWRQ